MKQTSKIFIALCFCLGIVSICMFSVFSAKSFMFEAEGVIDFVVLEGIDATVSSATLSGVTKQSGSGEMQSFSITRSMQDADIQALAGYKSWKGIKLAFTEESNGFAKISFTVTNNSTKPIENVLVKLSTNTTHSSPVWVAPSADFCVNYGESHTFEVDLIVQDPQQNATLENFNLTMEFDLIKPEDVFSISEYEQMGLTISPTTGSEAKIVSYTNTETPTVVLPSVAKDENDKIYTISEIADCVTYEVGAFDAVKETMTSITLPNTLTKIGMYAFYGCSALVGELKIPLSVETLGESAFCQCSGLTGNLNLPPKLTIIDMGVFAACENLTGVLKIPRGVTEILAEAFGYCPGFSGVIIPEGVTLIGFYCFSECSGMQGNLILPSTLKYMESSAFAGCSGFTGDLILPEGLEIIPDECFSGCAGFDGTLVLPSTITEFSSYYSFAECGFVEVICYIETPLSLFGSAFAGPMYTAKVPIYVLDTSYDAYCAASGWKQFTITKLSERT